MAILLSDALKLTNEDVHTVTNLEKSIDQYLSGGWAGPERPFDTGIIDLKWSICEELRKKYSQVGWDVGFKHPIDLSSNFGSILDPQTRRKSLPTLIHFNPLFGWRPVDTSTKKKNKKSKKGVKK